MRVSTGLRKEEMRILMINPNTSESFTASIQSIADQFRLPTTEVVAVSPKSGPRSIESAYDELLSAQPTIETLIENQEDFDAFVLACYSDHPAIHAAREMTSKPVIGIMEASLYTACMLGHRFSIVTTNDRWVPLLWDAIRRYGVAERCASVRATSMPVLALEGGGDQTVRERVLDEARKAIEMDGADVVCLGCAGMAGLHAQLSGELGVPVVDGVAMAVKLMEALVGYGARTSKKRAYAFPDGKELVRMPILFLRPYGRGHEVAGR